jgi:hypothetical protein
MFARRRRRFPGRGTEIPAANYDATRMPNLDDGSPTRTSVLNAAAEFVDLGGDIDDRAYRDGGAYSGDNSDYQNDKAD